MRTHLTLQQLESFVTLAKTSNFRAAAHDLNVSQPALSRTIKMMENELNARLFDRDTRHVEITPTGTELLPIAVRILENFNNSFSELSQFLDGRSGHITVATLPSTGVALLPNVMAAFRKQHPNIEFSFMEGPAEFVRNTINEGRADFGISVRPDPHEQMNYQHLFDDPFVLLCQKRDPLAKRTSVAWSVFTSQPFIASNFQSSIRPITDAAFLQKGLRVNSTLEYPSIAASGAMVAAGLGITALPQLALSLIKNDELTTVPLQRPSMSRPIGLITRIGRSLSPVTREFMHALRLSLQNSKTHGRL